MFCRRRIAYGRRFGARAAVQVAILATFLHASDKKHAKKNSANTKTAFQKIAITL